MDTPLLCRSPTKSCADDWHLLMVVIAQSDLWKRPLSDPRFEQALHVRNIWQAEQSGKGEASLFESLGGGLAGYSKVAKTASTKRMLVCGHRGDRVRTPEQTMPAFVEAVRAGADAIELDVQWTKDQRMVLMHDRTVDRTTWSTGTVTDMTYAEIRTCDAGSWFGPQFRGTQVPAL